MRNGEYELVKAPDDYPGKKYRGRYCYEHHLVWWQNTGTLPGPGEVLHHRNRNRRDNRFENLEKKSNSRHVSEHNSEQGRKVVVLRCPACQTIFHREARHTHVWVKRKKMTFCSRRCIGKFFYRGRKISDKDKKKIADASVVEVKRVSGMVKLGS